MAEVFGSDACEQGRHGICETCPCQCHPRHGRPAELWDPTVALRWPYPPDAA